MPAVTSDGMMQSYSTPLVETPTVSPEFAAYWILRVGAALCFIGHGAFGFITKAAWLPYFAVVGIPESLAWRIQPIVGAIDVLAAMAVLFAPRGLPLVYMSVWALWTALLRPMAGQDGWEAVERAGNYGVPFALLVLTGLPRSILDLFTLRHGAVFDELSVERVRIVLKWTTVLLLLGHGALGALSGKELLTSQYASIGLPGGTTMMIGWFEIALAVVVAIRPMAGLLLFISAWKVATESLFVASGAPVWELVERAGSYAAPLALAVLVSESYVSNSARALFGAARRGAERIASGPRLERST